MSVTIVSTLPKPTQATATDNAVAGSNVTSGDNAITLDFASLLRGQLLPVLPVVLETVQKTTVQTDLAVSDSEPTDAATLLAALGLIPQETNRKADTALVVEASQPDNAEVDSLVSAIPGSISIVPQASTVVGQDLVPSNKTKAEDAPLPGIGKLEKITPEASSVASQASTFAAQNIEESVKTVSAPSEIVELDERPAKFAAVTAATSNTEIVNTKIPSTDTTPNNIPALVSSTQGNTNPTTSRHDISLSVPTSVRDQSWASDFGQKIVWLARNDKQSAQITLNPPQMGPIEISLNLDKGSATASFVSANSEVRSALETAMPKLREMFASAGIELGQTNVSAESFRQQAGSGDENRGASQWRSDNAILVADSAISLSGRAFPAQHGNGLVDIFA